MSSRYRPPSTEPRGRWARHIHAFRKAHGWSQTEGFEAVRVGLGLSEKSRAAYIPIDIGLREPKPSEEEALAAVYGWPSEEAATEASTTEPSLAAALIALTEELRETRKARLDAEARLRALEAGVALLAQRAGVTPQELAALRN